MHNIHVYKAIAVWATIIAVSTVAWLAYQKNYGSSKGEMTFCTQEAMQCPDGSYVGREGPNCEFAACPGISDTSNWKTYRNEEYGFEVKYPSDWIYEDNGPGPFLESLSLARDAEYIGYESVTINVSQRSLDSILEELSKYLVQLKNEEKSIDRMKWLILTWEDENNSHYRNSIAAFTERNGKTFQIVAREEMKGYFDQILSTFKFIQ